MAIVKWLPGGMLGKSAPLVNQINSSSVTVPATVSFDVGATSATFNAITACVTSQSTVTITAGSGCASKSAMLTITPATLVSVSVSPASVCGGDNAMGTVTLSGRAEVDCCTRRTGLYDIHHYYSGSRSSKGRDGYRKERIDLENSDAYHFAADDVVGQH
jgi:hypothetical protein